MKNIAIFYHVWQGDGWETLFQQQIMSLYTSDLYQQCAGIYVCVNGRYRLPIDLPKFHIRYNEVLNNESDTLKEMWNFCSIAKDYKVLYFHTKGLSYGLSSGRPMVDAWRLYLEYYTIHKWKDCVEKLDQYDIVGTEWNNSPSLYIGFEKQVLALKNSGIYVGNFWWANSNYIKTLDPNYLYQYNAPHMVEGWPYGSDLDMLSDKDKQQILRFNSELWIGSNKPNHYSFKRFDIPFYDTNILNRLEEFE